MAQIATLLSDRARREGSALVGRGDLNLVEPLVLGQVVIIEDTSTGDRLLGWIADVYGADVETVYTVALGPVLPVAYATQVAHREGHGYRLQDVEVMLEEARAYDIRVPQPRDPDDDETLQDS